MKKIFVVSFPLCFILFHSCTHKPFPVPVIPGDPQPGPNDTGLCFDRDILPVFVSQCAKSGCHDQVTREENYVLDSYENIISRGVVPGNANGSKLYTVLLDDPDDRMPKDAPPLTAAQISLIKSWIDAGAKRDSNCTTICDSNSFTFSASIMPLINRYCTGCHSGASPSGNLLLSGYPEVKNAVLSRNLLKTVRYEPGYSGMPKGGVHLSACEVRQLEKWVDANMPNN